MPGPLTYAALTATAVLTGFIDSVAGGGGLIMMPALIWAGVPPAMLLGTNKAQSWMGTAMAVWRYRREGLFAVRPNLAAVAVVFVGAVAGALAISAVDVHWLGLVVPVLLMAVAVYTLLSHRMTDEDRHARLGARGFLSVGGVLGFYDGVFGPGAGQFYTTALVSLRGLGLLRATGLTKLLNLTSNVAGLLVFAIEGRVMWSLGVCVGMGALTGNWIGAHTASRHGARVIRPLLVVVSLGLTVKLVWGWFAGR